MRSFIFMPRLLLASFGQLAPSVAKADDDPPLDYLAIAQGATVVSVSSNNPGLKVTDTQARYAGGISAPQAASHLVY